MLIRRVQSVLQFTATQCSLAVKLLSAADFIMQALSSTLLLTNSLTPFSLYVSSNVMNSTQRLVTVLHSIH